VTPYRTGLLVQQYAVTRNYGVVLGTFEPGPVWVLLALLGLGLLAIGMAMLLEFVVSERERYGIQTAVLAIAGLVPGLTTVARITGLGPLFPFDLTPFAYAFVAPLVGYGMIRWDLFDFAPATQRVGQAAAIDDFGDAVLILDEDYRLVDLNEQAVDLFEESPRSLVGQPVETLIGAPPADIAPEASVRIQTNRGQRDYDVTRSPVEGSRGATIGYTLVLHDVTTEKQRRQRFEVLNRILRHDLRNAMNAIEGYAGELEAHADASVTWMVGRIERQSAHLVDLSEKARDIDRVTTPSHTKSSFAVERSVKRVAEQRPEDGAIVTVHVPDGLTLTSDEAVFEHAVEYAIDCLVSYNDGRETRIVVAATPTGNGRPRIDVRITSDGEPVPAAEREVIKRGEETPLAHSDDLDLWLVLWGVETLGGDLTFVDGDRPGLTLQIPDVR
jgi:PAS domain-containing protein